MLGPRTDIPMEPDLFQWKVLPLEPFEIGLERWEQAPLAPQKHNVFFVSLGRETERVLQGLLYNTSNCGRSRNHQWSRLGKRALLPIVLVYMYAAIFSFELGTRVEKFRGAWAIQRAERVKTASGSSFTGNLMLGRMQALGQ